MRCPCPFILPSLFPCANELLHEKGLFSTAQDAESDAQLIFCAFWPVAWGGLQSTLSLSFLPHWSRGGKWSGRCASSVPQGWGRTPWGGRHPDGRSGPF